MLLHNPTNQHTSVNFYNEFHIVLQFVIYRQMVDMVGVYLVDVTTSNSVTVLHCYTCVTQATEGQLLITD